MREGVEVHAENRNGMTPVTPERIGIGQIGRLHDDAMIGEGTRVVTMEVDGIDGGTRPLTMGGSALMRGATTTVERVDMGAGEEGATDVGGKVEEAGAEMEVMEATVVAEATIMVEGGTGRNVAMVEERTWGDMGHHREQGGRTRVQPAAVLPYRGVPKTSAGP
jgi:hypothetical protein